MRLLVIKIRGFALLLPALAFLTATSCSAQIFYPPVFYPPVWYPRPAEPLPDPKDRPVEVGTYATVGGGFEASPPPHTVGAVGSVGLYGQWNRYGLCPGLDLRIQGNQSSLHGYLVGPRVAYQPKGKYRPFRLYAEALFGKNEITYFPPSDTSFSTSGEHVGVTKAMVFGLDLHSETDLPFAWRVLEFTKGEFSGLAGSYPQTITTGIVFHLP